MPSPIPIFDAAVPILPVEDIAEAIRFYRDALGFSVAWTWGDPPTHASMARDDVELNLAVRDRDAGEGRSRVYLQVRGVDALFAELKDRGVELRREPEDEPYGMRDFDLDDPSGNNLCFGEPTVD